MLIVTCCEAPPKIMDVEIKLLVNKTDFMYCMFKLFIGLTLNCIVTLVKVATFTASNL